MEYKYFGSDKQYKIYKDGRIWGRRNKRFLKPEIHKGYLKVILSNKKIKTHYFVHRLIAKAFIPNTKNMPFVCHNNSISSDNRVENLRWDNAIGNMRDRKERGLYCQVGEKNYSAKLKEKDVRSIRNYARKNSPKEIKNIIKKDISLPTIYDIINRRSWKHI